MRKIMAIKESTIPPPPYRLWDGMGSQIHQYSGLIHQKLRQLQKFKELSRSGLMKQDYKKMISKSLGETRLRTSDLYVDSQGTGTQQHAGSQMHVSSSGTHVAPGAHLLRSVKGVKSQFMSAWTKIRKRFGLSNYASGYATHSKRLIQTLRTGTQHARVMGRSSSTTWSSRRWRLSRQRVRRFSSRNWFCRSAACRRWRSTSTLQQPHPTQLPHRQSLGAFKAARTFPHEDHRRAVAEANLGTGVLFPYISPPPLSPNITYGCVICIQIRFP